ncbi:MAG TPA: NHL repeat-containing protein [Candidatus Udaeobacter sp.]|nr:NHL repeat-containing protein [Candidatus Udaeobacter sp.]
MFILLCVIAALAGGPAAPVAAATPDSTAAAVAAPDSLPFLLRDLGVAGVVPVSLGAPEPSGVASDAFGRLFVSDARAHRVLRFDAQGRFLGGEGTLGSDPGQFRRPGAVALHGTLEVVVLDRENRRVARYDLLGHFLGVIIDLEASDLESEIGRVDPIDLACDRGGAFAIADRDQDRVLMFDVGGQFVRAIGGFGAKAGSFRGLAGLAFTARGDLVTAERGAGRLQRLDPGGRVAASWPLHAAASEGALPVAVSGDRVAVADERSGRLWLFDASGRPLASRTDLAHPRAITFANDGTLLVAEGAHPALRRLIAEPAHADTVRTE